MTMSDPIADMLTRIRNGVSARHDTVRMPSSKLKVAIAQVLREEGFIKHFEVGQEGTRSFLKIDLSYTGRKEPVLSGIKRVSKPGQRVYSRATELRPILNGLGISIISTSRGVISDREARQKKLGGEVLCELW